MSIRCDNCDQLLLADEKVCWQCGRAVTGAAGTAPTAVLPDIQEERRSRFELSPVVFYGTLTAMVAVGALLITILLGRQPLARVGPNDIPSGLEEATGAQRLFSVYLPEDWDQRDAEATEAAAFQAQLVQEVPAVAVAAQPLAALVEDEELLFYASPAGSSDATLFFVVTRSRALNELTLLQAVEAAQRSEGASADAAIVERYDSRTVSIRARIPLEEDVLTCRQRFATGRSYSLLAAACSLHPDQDQAMLDAVIDSFQRLAR